MNIVKEKQGNNGRRVLYEKNSRFHGVTSSRGRFFKISKRRMSLGTNSGPAYFPRTKKGKQMIVDSYILNPRLFTAFNVHSSVNLSYCVDDAKILCNEKNNHMPFSWTSVAMSCPENDYYLFSRMRVGIKK